MPSSPNTKTINTRSQTSKTPSNDDIIKAINSLSASQSSQFQELRASITDLTTRVVDLVADNAAFRAEISVLRSRIELLESRPIQSNDLTSIIFRESTERSKIEFNAIAYGLPESTASTAALRVKDDLLTLNNHLNNLSIPVPNEPKLVRLGNSSAKKPRPLKIICKSTSDASQLISNFKSQIQLGLSPPPGFNIVRDKTTLERNLLRQAHKDLEREMNSGSHNLTISYINGVPAVVKTNSKNMKPRERSNHHPSTARPMP